MATTGTTMEQEMTPFTPEEVACLVKLFREASGLTQETLAELSGLTVRTIQRVENAEPSSLDSRRALARAFELDDIDTFNRPVKRKTEEDLKREAEEFQKQYVVLSLKVVTSGKELAEGAEGVEALACDMPPDVPEEAANSIAYLFDYLQEYGDCWELYSAEDRVKLWQTFSGALDGIAALGYSISYGQRQVRMTNQQSLDSMPLDWSLGYFLAFETGHEREQVAIPRKLNFKT